MNLSKTLIVYGSAVERKQFYELVQDIDSAKKAIEKKQFFGLVQDIDNVEKKHVYELVQDIDNVRIICLKEAVI